MRKLVAIEPEVYQRLQNKTSVEQKIVSDLDRQMLSILNSDLPQEQKIALYNQALQKLIHFEKKQPTETKAPVAEGSILKKISKPKQTRAKKVIKQIRESKNAGWDDQYRFMLDQQPVPGSNILDLVDEAATRVTKSRKRKKPTGWREFEAIWHTT